MKACAQLFVLMDIGDMTMSATMIAHQAQLQIFPIFASANVIMKLTAKMTCVQTSVQVQESMQILTTIFVQVHAREDFMEIQQTTNVFKSAQHQDTIEIHHFIAKMIVIL